MTKYTIYDQRRRLVGHTTNHAEMQSFLDAHPGYSQRSEGWPDGKAESTLPTLQENPVKPKGDFLRQ